MQHSALSHRQILDEDLQIIRVTLATINDDVRNFSSQAADAITEALEKLDRAQWEFTHVSSTLSGRLRSLPYGDAAAS
jgi:hypothetical protein